jgi:hypothetical protein
MAKLLTLVWILKGFVKSHNFNNGEDKSYVLSPQMPFDARHFT